jgi:hypothetical protein
MGPKQDIDEQAPGSSDDPGSESLLDQSLSRVLDVLDAVSANRGEEDALVVLVVGRNHGQILGAHEVLVAWWESLKGGEEDQCETTTE